VALQVIKALLGFLGLLFHGLFCLALLLLSSLALAAGAQSLQLGMLPWTGTTLLYTLLGGSIAGLVIVVLAARGIFKPVFFGWSLAVLLLLVKGYIFSSYHFSPGEFRGAVYLIVGSLIALLGAWFRMGSKPAAR
jgi:hypothetical protein